MKTESEQKATVKNLKEQKKRIAEQISQLSGRCNELRERKRNLEEEREQLLNAPVTKADFINALCSEIDTLGNKYPESLSRMLADKNWHSGIIRDPILKKVTDAGIMKGAADRSLSAHIQNPRDFSAFFYIFKDQIKDGIARAINQIIDDTQEPFKNAIPLKESMARIDEIDAEIGQIDAELDELTESAQLFGESI